METKKSEYRSWDDIVFENRNKEYGAYVLRRSYSDQLLKGLCASIGIMAVLVIFSIVMDSGPSRDVIVDLRNDGFSPLPKPTIIPREQPRSVPVEDRRIVRREDLPPRVVTEPVEETPLPVENPVTSSSPAGEGEVGGATTVGAEGILPGVGIETAVGEGIVSIAEVMPRYEGGNEAMMKFLRKHLRYPASPQRMGIEGTVYVEFVVKGDGTVTDVRVVRGFHPDCDKEAARVISKLPGWIGGKQGGTPVGVRMVLPIKFQIK